MATGNSSSVHALLAGRRRILITGGAVWTVDLVLPQELTSDLLVPLSLRKPDGLHS
ncbi:MAG: hypothetical protein NTV57_20180 [Cyanobacteria bacterium]|nr:hypothetical protein [Cyanobacteriota bacterium]